MVAAAPVAVAATAATAVAAAAVLATAAAAEVTGADVPAHAAPSDGLRVLLAGAEGWAFSKPFRMELANSGLEVRLRPMPDAHDA